MARKKILVLTSTFPRWDGDHEPSFIFDLCERLARHFEIHVLAPHAAGTSSYEEINGLSIHRYHYAPERLEKLAYNGGIAQNLNSHPVKYLLVIPFIVMQLIAASRLIRRHKLDLIHAHWLIPQGLVAGLLRNLPGHRITTLITAHGSDIFSFNGSVTKKIKQYVLKNCDQLTVVSRAMKITVLQMGCGCPVDVMPMGTDLSTTFVPDSSRRNARQIVFIGRLIAQKGVACLLDAFSKVLIEDPAVSLLIIGSGPELESLKKQADELDISSNVFFQGGVQHEEVVTYLQSSTIAVFPYQRTKQSGEEGFGLVLVEALGCGCAVIASRQPAIMEIIKDNQTGLLIDEKDPQAISQSILKLLNNPEQRNLLAERGRADVLKRFDWAQVSQSYITLINNCLNK
jgi:glycosyltransferase involved in cell wall biosynthesis